VRIISRRRHDNPPSTVHGLQQTAVAAAANEQSLRPRRTVRTAQRTHHNIILLYSQLACSSSTTLLHRQPVDVRPPQKTGKVNIVRLPLPPTHNVIISPHTLPVSPDPNVPPPLHLPSTVVSTQRHGPRSQPQDPSSMILYCKQTGH